MKTENFDDAIRRKVESIHHSFNDEDIDRVHDFVSASKAPVSFWKAFGFGSVVTTSVLVISGLLFWNIKQMQEQKVLISKIETLEKNEILLKANQAEILKNEASYQSQKVDFQEKDSQIATAEANTKKSFKDESSDKIIARTVAKETFISKKSIASTQIASEDYDTDQAKSAKKYQSENASEAKHRSSQNKIKSTVYENNDLQKESINSFEETQGALASSLVLNNSETKSTLTENNENTSDLNNTKTIEEKTSEESDNADSKELVASDTKTSENSDVTLSTEVKGKKVLNAANTKKTKTRNVNPPINTKTEKSNMVTKRESKSVVEKPAKVKRSKRSPENASMENETNVLFKSTKKPADPNKAESSAMTKKDTVAENKEKIVALNNATFPDSVASSAEQKNELPLLKPLLQYQLGVGLEKTKDQGGGAILGEIILNKRFGFSLGIKLLSTNDEKYDDLNDYHRQRNRYINEFNTFPDTSISDIGVVNTVFQLPIAFTYYQPLKKNFSLLFSLGTDIDLFSKQNLKYQYHTGVFNDPDRHQDFEIKRTNFMFNNVVLSAGLQKQWKHFVFQASPYISPQIRPVDYKNDKLNIGFRVRAFYRF